MYIHFPFQIDSSQDVAQSDHDDHVQELLAEILLVSPGERVNRPDFGCPLIERVFAAETDEIAATTRTMVQTSLQTWLGGLILVLGVTVQYRGDQMVVTVSYLDRLTQTAKTASCFVR